MCTDEGGEHTTPVLFSLLAISFRHHCTDHTLGTDNLSGAFQFLSVLTAQNCSGFFSSHCIRTRAQFTVLCCTRSQLTLLSRYMPNKHTHLELIHVAAAPHLGGSTFLYVFFPPWKSPKIFSPSDVTVKRVKILLYTQVSREKKGKLMQREDAVLPEKGPLTLTEIKNCQQVQLKTGSLYSGKHDTSLHFLKCVHPQISHHSLSQALFISCYHSCQHLQEQPAETGSYS